MPHRSDGAHAIPCSYSRSLFLTSCYIRYVTGSEPPGRSGCRRYRDHAAHGSFNGHGLAALCSSFTRSDRTPREFPDSMSTRLRPCVVSCLFSECPGGEIGRRKGLKSPQGQSSIRGKLKPCGRGGIGRRNGLKRKLECSPGNRRSRTAQIRGTL